MSKCPECGREVEFLVAIVTERNMYYYNKNGDYEISEQLEFDVDYYKCPHCRKQLNLNDADEFLGVSVPL